MFHSITPRFGAVYSLNGKDAHRSDSARNFSEDLCQPASCAFSHDTGTYIVVDGDEHAQLKSLYDNLTMADGAVLEATNQTLKDSRESLLKRSGELREANQFASPWRVLDINAQMIQAIVEGATKAISTFNATASEKLKAYQAAVEKMAQSGTPQEAPGPGRLKLL